MTFFCYIDTQTSAVPYMEALPVDSLEEARFLALRMLGQHRKALAAHIFREDDRVDTLIPLI